MFEVDALKIYRGKDIHITDKIIVRQPTLDEIIDFGEQKYFNAIYTLTSVGADLKWQLWDYYNIDYTQINDYDLFINIISQLVSSKRDLYNELVLHPDEHKEEINKMSDEDINDLLINPLQIILNIDLADFDIMQKESNGQMVLYDTKRDIVIDRLVYSNLIETVRKIHGLKRNNQMPANETTKRDLIEDARDDYNASKNKPYKSSLLPLASSLKVYCHECGKDDIWNMRIGEFFYDIRRVYKMIDADALLKGAFSGFADLKDVDKNRFDWAGDLSNN